MLKKMLFTLICLLTINTFQAKTLKPNTNNSNLNVDLIGILLYEIGKR